MLGGMAPRVLVVDRSAATRDAIAELLGEHAGEVAWSARETALGTLRTQHAAGQPFDVVLLESEPALTAALVRELAAAGRGKVVRIWDILTGQELLVLAGHKAQINALAFSPDGSTLTSCAHDGAVKLWRASPVEGIAPH